MKSILLLGVVGIIAAAAGIASADVLIIGHKNVPETTLTKHDVQEIFLGKRVQWRDHTTIHPVTVKVPQTHQAFLKQYLNKPKAKWNAYWKRMVFTGQGSPPEQVETQEALLEFVVNTKGAVGYIDVERPVVENVTIIEVR